jgi:hypothetical protein
MTRSFSIPRNEKDPERRRNFVLRKQTNKQTKACSCQHEHTILTGTHAFFDLRIASDAKLPWDETILSMSYLKATSVLYNGSQHNLLGKKLISRANQPNKKKGENVILQLRMKPRSQISSHFSSPFFLPLSRRVMEPTTTILESQLYSSKACQPFCAWQLCFGKLLFYLSIS